MGLGIPGAASCALTRALSQAGQFGTVTGSYDCPEGGVGTFQFFEMNVGVNHLTGRLSMSEPNTGCKATGYFAGMRHRP